MLLRTNTPHQYFFYYILRIFWGLQFNPFPRYIILFSCNRWCLGKIKGIFHPTFLITPSHPNLQIHILSSASRKPTSQLVPALLTLLRIGSETLYSPFFVRTLDSCLKDETMKLTKTYSQIPFLAAMWRGNRPSLLALLASAPWDKRNSTMGTCPFLQAS